MKTVEDLVWERYREDAVRQGAAVRLRRPTVRTPEPAATELGVSAGSPATRRFATGSTRHAGHRVKGAIRTHGGTL